MTRDCLRKVTVGLLEQVSIEKLRFVAEVSEIILCFSPGRSRVGVKAARMPLLIERDVAEGNVFFQFRSMCNPLS